MENLEQRILLIVIIFQVELRENFWCWTLCQSWERILNLMDTDFANIMKVVARLPSSFDALSNQNMRVKSSPHGKA